MADATEPINLSVVGTRTGKPYSGKFLVKTVLSRRENFMADERRRFILGANALSAPPALQGEAFMLGQLYVRIAESPDWWRNSDGGLDLEDENVIGELFKLIEGKVEESEDKLQAEAKVAVEKLANSSSKKNSEKADKASKTEE